ncbi:1,2-phenylacetyl-CoA epoxidase subunit PaaB [Parvicella tangerina]|uniref:1,2-phenylacetyl-CoA epoxidase, subunit B n=1 Tax=Parvicella tangerina TaxID=2829795 RepID=A0A916JIS6_9FLAO|nr:1,2-phenylacetyl-CoA epoxidase subunit PaaB [Parvicella tangerina]CAG5076457.1 1,2-phenylacetyl-CoA epoxidase, subunit B [Parvicella tangerina]
MDNQGDLWEVFIQPKPGRPFKHAGSLHAYDKKMAMEAARDLYTRRNEGTGLWLVKAEDIVASQPEDMGEFFDPANDKAYRHPTFYTMPEGSKHI